jgi:hypothetical protein
MPRRIRPLVVVAALLATGLVAPATAGAATSDPEPIGFGSPSVVPAAGTFYPTAVTRVLGTATTGYAVAPDRSVTVPTAGRGTLPSSGVSALMVNLTATAAATDVRLGVAATGSATAGPILAVPAGTARSILLTVPLVTSTGFDVTSQGGAAIVTADVVGFYAADDTVVAGRGLSGGYQPVDATRLHESTAADALPAGGRALLAVDLGAQANAHATALLVRVTSKDTSAVGALAVTAASVPLPSPPGAATATTPKTPATPATPAGPAGPGDDPAALPATVSFGAGAAMSNLALVPAEVDSDGRIPVAVTNAGSGTAGYALDLVGFYDDGAIGPNLRFRPLPQTSVLDPASGRGGSSTLAPGARQRATPADAVVSDSTFGLVGVLTASTTTASTVGVFSDDIAPEAADSAPIGAGTTSLAVQAEVGAQRGVSLIAGYGAAPVELSLDVVGSFEAFPPVSNPAARGWVPPVAPWQISAAAR